MMFNEIEKEKIGRFIIDMEQSKETDVFQIEWESGTKILGSCIAVYETDNDLELDDPSYEEYCAAAIKVIKIINNGPEINMIFNNEILEINYHRGPSLWERLN